MANIHSKGPSVALFLIGLFSETKIWLIGFIGVSELVVFFIAPFLYFKEAQSLKRNGFGPFIRLTIMVIIANFVASFWNSTILPSMLKGAFTPYAMFAFTVVYYHLLKDDYRRFKWYLLGFFFSGILSIFFLSGAAAVSHGELLEGSDAVDWILDGPLFWCGRILPALTLPVKMFYMQCPVLYSVLAPLVVAVMNLTMSKGSGRSGFLMAVVGAALIAIGRKRASSMSFIKRNFPLFLVASAVLLVGIKQSYQVAATRGWIGEEATKKFEDQSHRGTDILSLLIAGRVDTFVGIYACIQNPIIGYGPWPEDVYGYRQKFLYKYGTPEEQMLAVEYDRLVQSGKVRGIPAHSHLIGFWVDYGIVGFLFWSYVLYLMYKTLRYNMNVLPQLYGYFALMLPSMGWNVLFSPFSQRATYPMMITLMLITMAVRKGKLILHPRIEMENVRYKR